MRRKPTVAGAGAKPLTWNVDEIPMKVPSRRMPAAPVHTTPVRVRLFLAALLAVAGMRTFIVASMVMTVFLTGCDPVGLRRICGFRPPGHQCLESEGVSPFEAPPEIRDGFPFAAGNDGRKTPVGGWSVIAGVTLATSVSGSSRHPEDSHGLHSRGGKVVSG